MFNKSNKEKVVLDETSESMRVSFLFGPFTPKTNQRLGSHTCVQWHWRHGSGAGTGRGCNKKNHFGLKVGCGVCGVGPMAWLT